MTRVTLKHDRTTLNYFSGVFYLVVKVKSGIFSGILVWMCFLNSATFSGGQIRLHSNLKSTECFFGRLLSHTHARVFYCV